MSDKRWESEGRFFTSPWNYMDSARAALAFPDGVVFHDVTLHDGEQQAGVGFSTAAAKQAGLYSVFFTIDSSRSELDWYLDLVARVASEGHMDALALVDTFGVVTPQAIPEWVRRVRERLPDTPLEAHFHDDFGLAVANTVAALGCGVGVVHSTVTGLGERAGNTPMEELALALEMLYGIKQGLRTEEFYGLSRLVRERAGHSVPSNRAAVGDRLYQVESGIIASWLQHCVEEHPTEVFPYHWGVVGQPAPQVVYGKGSGLASVEIARQTLGLQAGDEEKREILRAIKDRGLSLKSLLALEEVAELIADVRRRGAAVGAG